MSPTAGGTRPPGSVLLIKPGSLGDVVHALPVASALRRAWPRSTISWLVDSRWCPLLEGNSSIDRFVVFPRERFTGAGGFVRGAHWMAGLRRLHPELAIDLQGLSRSALMAKASRASRIIGLSDSREGATLAYGRTVRVDHSEHAVLRYLRVLGPLGIDTPVAPEFPLPVGVPPAGFDLPERGFVVLHPFARGAGKSLSPDIVAALCSEFRDLPVVVVGRGPHGLPPLPAHALDLTGKTDFPALLWLLRQARAVMSVDSGPMHIAAAVNPALLSIHTWSDPRKVGPFSTTASIWRNGEIRPQDLGRSDSSPGRDVAPGDVAALAHWLSESVSS